MSPESFDPEILAVTKKYFEKSVGVILFLSILIDVSLG